MGCYSYTVNRDAIWKPGIGSDNGNKEEEATTTTEEDQLADLPDSTEATVLADGRVMDSFWGQATLRCKTIFGASKECKLGWRDVSGNRNIAYVAKGGGGSGSGVVVRDPVSMPPSGYKLNETATKLKISMDDDLGEAVQRVELVLQFDPLELDCNVCGDDKGTKLIPDVVPNQPKPWKDLFPHTEDWTCKQLDEFLIPMTVGNRACTIGRAFFEEACCDDVRSSFVCESSIHDALAGRSNTITPPDVSFSNSKNLNLGSPFVDFLPNHFLPKTCPFAALSQRK